MRRAPRQQPSRAKPGDRSGRPSGALGALAGSTRTIAVLFATALAAAGGVRAQPVSGWKQMTAKQLAAECHATEPARRAACVAYVEGIYDLQFAPSPPRGVCPPADFTPDLLAEVVTAYIDTHDDGPAPPAVGQAIVRFFPCAEQHR